VEIGSSSGHRCIIELRDVIFKENDSGGPSHLNIQVEDTGTKPFEKGKQEIEAKDSPVNQESVAIHVKEILHEDEGDLEGFLRNIPLRELRRSSHARKASTRNDDANYFLDAKDLPCKLETRHVEVVAGGPDADLWPRWKKDINGEPVKVKKEKLTFGMIESGATGTLRHRDCTAVEGGISGGSSTVNNGDGIQDLPDSVGALSGPSARPGEKRWVALMGKYHYQHKTADKQHQQTTNFVTIPTSINKHPQRFHKLPQTHKESQSLQSIN